MLRRATIALPLLALALVLPSAASAVRLADPPGPVCTSDFLRPEFLDIDERLPAGSDPSSGGATWLFIPVLPAEAYLAVEEATKPTAGSGADAAAPSLDVTRYWGLMNIVCAALQEVLDCVDPEAALGAGLKAAAPASALCDTIATVQAVAACLQDDPNGWSRCTSAAPRQLSV